MPKLYRSVLLDSVISNAPGVGSYLRGVQVECTHMGFDSSAWNKRYINIAATDCQWRQGVAVCGLLSALKSSYLFVFNENKASGIGVAF